MAYRDELEALKERHALLERNLDEIQKVAKTLEATRAQEAEVREQIAVSAARLEAMGGKARRALPMLDNVEVASPCSADWNTMKGSDRVRHCGDCKKDVYDLSAMSRDDAEALLQREGELCIAFYRRADGTILTADCPVGVKNERKKRRNRELVIVAIGAAMLAAMAVHSLGQKVECRVMGAKGSL